jgi:hypothetical protein
MCACQGSWHMYAVIDNVAMLIRHPAAEPCEALWAAEALIAIIDRINRQPGSRIECISWPCIKYGPMM